ncbi:SWIM zinc finger family protein [Pseudogracilibacillus auburnensis]|uniref:SWIM zinc finger family protein n=1 Tax=Pseudogracilibacillus auburnensis TaxID=1494959 RepID=UPI001A973072|nr:SWIM zinc finger family protein [Pseudogracilibacillus auburnensis]MBO1004758.1 hypothetical protein [Pseudogracilibacillus auburnensis]
MYNRQLLQQIHSYSSELQRMLDARSDAHQKLIQKGMMLFRHQHVYSMKFSNGKVEARVRDVSDVQVELFFEQMDADTCSCPEEGICRHQIAVFFTVLSRTKSVFLWMQEWKDHWKVKDVLSTLQRGSDLLKKVPQEEEEEDKGPDQWLERIQQAYHHVSAKNFYQLDEWARTCYRRLLGFAPVEREWKPLFQLFATCESMRIMNELANEPKKMAHLRSFVEMMIEEADEAIIRLGSIASPFAFDEYFYFLRKNSALFLEEETVFPTEYTDIYMKLWSMLFKNSRDRNNEWNRLQAVCDDANMRQQIALIHLSILLEKDELALNKIKEVGKVCSPHVLRWIKLLQSDRSQTRLIYYLPTFLEYMTDFISSLSKNYEQVHFTRALFQVIDSTTAVKMDSSLLEKVYIKLLPHSRFRYNEYLLAKKDFRKWAELQVHTNNHLEYIDRHTIDAITKEDPAALGPLYHQTITLLINQRSRDSYKRAVRYLKRLKKLYNRQKKMPQWEDYFTQLLLTTRRLRAFQEECRKGKLVE